jgi:8-oxo-dGTP pyrophosphatase MutT (NUDIX family)/phosphohistidine phosphatase SixA
VTPEQAAGVLCWRRARDGLEVLLVHRPRYDDWSWPKGKTRSSELLPTTALREAAEETGLVVRLGRPLGQVRYLLPGGRPKEVTYWAAVPTGVDAHGDDTSVGGEVDGVAWLPVAEARAVLTRATDAVPLDVLEKHAAAGELDTVPLLVVRHGTSRRRASWARADADRPLASAGRRQARRLVPLLACWCPERIVSSPWRRCIETIAPFAEVASLRVIIKESLSEVGAGRSPQRARRQVQRLLDRAQPVLLCTHRPVLGEVFTVLRDAAPRDVAAEVPAKDPFLAPGEVLVAHMLPTGPPRVVTVERHQPQG